MFYGWIYVFKYSLIVGFQYRLVHKDKMYRLIKLFFCKRIWIVSNFFDVITSFECEYFYLWNTLRFVLYFFTYNKCKYCQNNVFRFVFLFFFFCSFQYVTCLRRCLLWFCFRISTFFWVSESDWNMLFLQFAHLFKFSFL